MEEEKIKKSITANDDNNDENSSRDTDSEQRELSSILGKLSLGGPKKENKKKKLLILSPNGLLVHRLHKMRICEAPKNRSPDASYGPNLLYMRPFAEDFMKFCLERFEVGIWSSAFERNAIATISVFPEDLKDKLLFVWGQEKCTESRMKTLDNSGKPMLFKELSKVFQSFKGFSSSNTIFVDDAPYKAFLNSDNTGVFPLTYDPTDEKDDLLDPKGEFCSYLEGLANSLDVQGYIKEHSFGQPKIDSSHPNWSYYRKALMFVS